MFKVVDPIFVGSKQISYDRAYSFEHIVMPCINQRILVELNPPPRTQYSS